MEENKPAVADQQTLPPQVSQAQKMMRQAQAKVEQILTAGEKILYIVAQDNPFNPVANMSRDCVALTNRRFIIYRPKLLGRVSFEDYIWRDLRDAHLNEGFTRASVTFMTTQGKVFKIDNLPKKGARRIYAVAQEMEEKVLEERRQRAMEEKRAAAGGVIFQGGVPAPPPVSIPTPPQEDPVAKLKQLKTMLDVDLITQEEYDAKKDGILSRM